MMPAEGLVEEWNGGTRGVFLGVPVGFVPQMSQHLSWLGVLAHTGVYWCTGGVGATLCAWRSPLVDVWPADGVK